MREVFVRTPALTDKVFHYCPGCGHGLLHRLEAEVLEELGVLERTIAIAPVGCAVYASDYIKCDWIEAAHGRAPAVALGIKRALPDAVVFTHQGDGDLAAIGTAETVHAATRGDRVTIIFVNNAVYGMTQGQMAPTTPVGMVTTTCPSGRDPETAGYPVPVSEMLSTLPGVVYIERVAVNKPVQVVKAKKAIKKAFEVQLKGLGFALVEVLSPCPTFWKMEPVEAFQHIDDQMAKVFPPGCFKDLTGGDGDGR